jgi:PAS domain S-box-containing protein
MSSRQQKSGGSTEEPRWFDSLRCHAIPVGVIAIIAGGALLSWWAVTEADRALRADLLRKTRLIAETVNHDRVKALAGTTADPEKPEYRRLKQQLAAIRRATDQCQFVCLMVRQSDGTLVCLVDDEPAGSAGRSPTGMRYDDAPEGLRRAMETGAAVVQGPATGPRGVYVGACAPVVDQTGKTIATLVVGFDTGPWRWALARAAVPAALLTLALIAILFVGTVFGARRARLAGAAPRWMRRLEPALVVAVGLVLTTCAAWAAHQNEHHVRQEAFAQLAASRTLAIAASLRDLRDYELEGLARFYRGSEHVTLEEFQQYTEFLTNNPAVQAWEWVPAVAAAEKASFEAAAREAGMAGFEVWAQDARGKRVPAAGREVYYPVLYVSPMGVNERAVGYDLGSEALCRAAIEEAARTGLITGSDPMAPVQKTAGQRAMLVLHPVFSDAAPRHLRGFVVAVLRPERLLASAGPDILATHLEIVLRRPDGGIEPLGTTSDADKPTGTEFSMLRPVFAFGHVFAVTARADAAFLHLHPARAGWLTTAAGAALSAAMAFVLGMILRGRAALEQLVAERTSQLQESEALLRIAGRTARFGGWSADPVTRRTVWSEEVALIHDKEAGYSPPAEEGMAYYAHEWRDRIAAVFEACARDGTPYDEEMEIITARGRRRWIRTTGEAVRDRAGRIIRVQGAFQDITERRQAEQSLRESEEKMRSIFRVAPTGIGIVRDRMLLDANPRVCEMTGYTRDELVGQSARMLYPTQEDFEFVGQEKYRQIAEHGSGQVETRWQRKDGSCIDILLASTPIDLEDRSKGVIFTALDITERKRAEEELQKLAAIVKHSAELVNLAAMDGQMVFLNEAGARLLGIEPAEAKGRNIMDIIPAELMGLVQQELWPALQQGRTWQGELRYRNLKTGRQTDCQAMCFTIKDPETGKPLYAANISLDITERKRAEAEREKLQAQLLQAQKMESVGRLAGGVAHDFNNTLQAILGHAEMAMEQMNPAQPPYTDLAEVRKAAERAAAVTRQLLAFARKQTAAPKLLDLNASVEGILKMLRRLIGEDIDLAWLPGKGLGLVKMDPSQVDQILANLCVNARDAIAGVGKVTIETGAVTFEEAYCATHAGFLPGDYVLLAVSDNGCGMDEHTLDNIFEPFFTTKDVGQGTGLGLATVYGIMKQNDGFINVYSEPGRGTTFKLYLPQQGGTPEQFPEQTEAAETAARGHETVLLVEDEPAILKVAAMMLKELGYTVLAASSPSESLRLAQAHPGEIDLLMTDVVMPEMSGLDLAKKLLADHPKLKHVFVSGYTANVIAHHGVLEPGVHFVQKPFTMKELAAKIRHVLDHG